MKRVLLQLWCVICVIASFVVSCDAATYRIHDLGVVGCEFYFYGANDINDGGQAVGAFNPPDWDCRTAIWQDGVREDISAPDMYFSVANSISNHGQIVGTAAVSRDPYAFLWQDGEFQTLEGYHGSAYDINDLGQIVGVVQDPQSLISHAVLWQEGVMTNLGSPNDQVSVAVKVNNHGQAVGFSYNSDDGYRGLLWQDGVMQALEGRGSSAHSINEQGQIVGEAIDPQTLSQRAVLWQNGVLQYLDVSDGHGSVATGINDIGSIIGYYFVGDSDTGFNHRAFVLKDGVTQYLDSLGGDFSHASSINNNGWIVGVADDAEGVKHSVLWQPVPEPASLLALAAGLAGLVIKRRR